MNKVCQININDRLLPIRPRNLSVAEARCPKLLLARERQNGTSRLHPWGTGPVSLSTASPADSVSEWRVIQAFELPSATDGFSSVESRREISYSTPQFARYKPPRWKRRGSCRLRPRLLTKPPHIPSDAGDITAS